MGSGVVRLFRNQDEFIAKDQVSDFLISKWQRKYSESSLL